MLNDKMMRDFKSVTFWNLSLNGEFIDRIYTSDIFTDKQVYDNLISKGFNPAIEIEEVNWNERYNILWPL